MIHFPVFTGVKFEVKTNQTSSYSLYLPQKPERRLYDILNDKLVKLN